MAAMMELEWLISMDARRMLDALQRGKLAVGSPADGLRRQLVGSVPQCRPTDRRMRLFSCAYLRQKQWNFLWEARIGRAVELAERYAEGEAIKEELIGLSQELNGAAHEALRAYRTHVWDRYRAVATALQQLVGGGPLNLPPNQSQALTLADLLRDIFGNPWRPVTPVNAMSTSEQANWHEMLRWHDGTVLKMTQAIYQSREFADMPILADALEEAGCTSKAILSHCRGGGPHTRGCWALDLILEKT